MRAVYGILAAVILVVLFGLFSFQTSKTKAYVTGEGSHDIELVSPKEFYSKHDFKPQNIPVAIDTLSVEDVLD